MTRHDGVQEPKNERRNGASEGSESVKRVALVGNPNVGKTTIFNALTGMRQKVGNYPGVTVERKVGTLSKRGSVEIIDLPGAYSLDPKSQDEKVVGDVLTGRMGRDPEPDLVVCVADAGNLERNLYLVTQIIDLGIPTILALNMLDVAEERGLEIDVVRLSEELGIPVFSVSALKNKGIRALRAAILSSGPDSGYRRWTLMPAVRGPVSKLMTQIRALRPTWTEPRCFSEALRALTSDTWLERWKSTAPEFYQAVLDTRTDLEKRKVPYRQSEIIGRYTWLTGVATRSVQRKTIPTELSISDRIDTVLTHHIWGPILFFTILAIVFQSIFSWATPAMDLIESAVGHFGGWVHRILPEGLLADLIVDGAIAGVGNVLVFLPQILLLFFFLGLMEDTGYMARSALILDRMMRRVGLSGGSVVPLLSSFACAIPGIMAARTLDNERDRLITIMVAPLMSCSARLPIYTLFIAAFIPAGAFFGIVGYQGLAMFSLYLFGTVMAFVAAWILKTFVFKSGDSYFAIELPPYRAPQMKQVLWRMLDRSKAFISNAGSIIFVMSILMWGLASFPRSQPPDELVSLREEAETHYESERSQIISRGGPEVEPVLDTPEYQEYVTRLAGESQEDPAVGRLVETWTDKQVEVAHDLAAIEVSFDAAIATLDDREASHQIRNSLIGRFGRFIEPAMQPLGFDWKMSAGIVAAFAAREVIISVLATLYSVGDADESGVFLRDQLRADTYPDTGLPVYTPLVAVSLMVFFVFALQCMSTLAIAKKETNSWRWPIVMWLYMTGLAYLFSLLIYQGGSALGLG